MGWDEKLEMTPSQAASALDWWREAGVDTLVGETPRDWLKPAPVPEPLIAVSAAPAVEAMPDSLGAFQAWMANAALPFAAPTAPRLAPAGDGTSGLMVMIDMPSLGGTIFDEQTNALFESMLGERAMNVPRQSLYLAPLSPLRPPSGRLDPASERSLSDIARHHIGLVKPKVLLLFGDGCARALLGGPVMATRGRWHELATPSGAVRATATIKPENMLNRPAYKKTAWADLQMVMEELKA